MKSKSEFPRHRVVFWGLVIIVGLACSPMLLANEEEHEGEHQEIHAEEAHHKHTLALFLGVTREHEEDLGTVGLEYSYRINQLWTVGGLIERAEQERESTIGLVFVNFWPWRGLILGGGVGRKDPGEEREWTYRASLAYEWEIGESWLISAQAHLDFIENHDREEVYGFAFGRRF